jgi:hypothetical protein
VGNECVVDRWCADNIPNGGNSYNRSGKRKRDSIQRMGTKTAQAESLCHWNGEGDGGFRTRRIGLGWRWIVFGGIVEPVGIISF